MENVEENEEKWKGEGGKWEKNEKVKDEMKTRGKTTEKIIIRDFHVPAAYICCPFTWLCTNHTK